MNLKGTKWRFNTETKGLFEREREGEKGGEREREKERGERNSVFASMKVTKCWV